MLSIKRAYQEVDLVVSSDPRSGKEAPSWGYFSSEDADAYYKNPGIKQPIISQRAGPSAENGVAKTNENFSYGDSETM